VREEIVRHRLGIALRARREPAPSFAARWRRSLGCIVIGLGRVIEGDERAAESADALR